MTLAPFAFAHPRAVVVLAASLLLGGCSLMTVKNEPTLSARLSASKTIPARAPQEKAATPPSAEEGLRLARLLRDQDRLEGASEVYAQLAQRQQLKPLEMLEYASVAAAVRSPQESLSLYGQARRALSADLSRLPPSVVITLCNGMGRARMALNLTDQAMADFDCVLKADGDNVVALNAKAVLLDTQGQHAQAQDLLRHAAELAPADFGVINNLALSHMAQGQFAQAERLLLQTDASALPALKLNLALAYTLQGRSDQARKTLQSLMSPALAERALADFEQRRVRIADGSPIGSELLAASRQQLVLKEVKPNE